MGQLMLGYLFDETGNDAVAQSYSATSLCRRKIRVLSGNYVSSVEVWFWPSLLARCRLRPNVGMVRPSGGSASTKPSLSMHPGRGRNVFDVGMV